MLCTGPLISDGSVQVAAAAANMDFVYFYMATTWRAIAVRKTTADGSSILPTTWRARRCGVRREQPITRRRVVLLVTIGRAGRLLLEESVVSRHGGRNREPLNSPSQYAAVALVMSPTCLPRSHQSRLGDDIGGDSCRLAEASPLQ